MSNQNPLAQMGYKQSGLYLLLQEEKPANTNLDPEDSRNTFHQALSLTQSSSLHRTVDKEGCYREPRFPPPPLSLPRGELCFHLNCHPPCIHKLLIPIRIFRSGAIFSI
ncbi:hypothetical protein HN51_052209 [Arachis hypogaea]